MIRTQLCHGGSVVCICKQCSLLPGALCSVKTLEIRRNSLFWVLVTLSWVSVCHIRPENISFVFEFLILLANKLKMAALGYCKRDNRNSSTLRKKLHYITFFSVSKILIYCLTSFLKMQVVFGFCIKISELMQCRTVFLHNLVVLITFLFEGSKSRHLGLWSWSMIKVKVVSRQINTLFVQCSFVHFI